MPVVNPGIRRQVAGAITRLFNSAAFALPLTHTAVPTRGSITPTFTRATTETGQKWDEAGYLDFTALAGEMVFKGARRERNLIPTSSDVTSATWSGVRATKVTVAGYDGLSTATKLISTGALTSRFLIAANTFPATGTFQLYAYIKNNGNPWVIFGTDNSAGKAVWFNVATGAVGTQSTGYVGAIEAADNGYYLCSIKIDRATASVLTNLIVAPVDADGSVTSTAANGVELVSVQYPMLSDITGETDQTTIRPYVSVGVESAPSYHGSMVDGVKCFPTDRSGNPISTSGSYPIVGYVPWEARTNVCLQSNAFTTAPWGAVGTPAATQNAVGPNGQANYAWTLGDDSAVASEFFFQSIASAANTSTWQIKVKKTTGAQAAYPVLFMEETGASKLSGVTVDTTNGVVTPWTAFTGFTINTTVARIRSHNADFWLIELVSTKASAGAWVLYVYPAGTKNATQSTGLPDATAVGTHGFCDSMLELGVSSASSYTPTTTVAVARNADLLTYTGADVANIKTLAATFSRGVGVNTASVALRLSDNTSNNANGVNISTVNAVTFVGVASGGVEWATAASNPYVAGTTSKVAWSAATNDIKMDKDGVAQTPDTAATIPVVTQLHIGHGVGSFQLNGPVNHIYGWTRNLSQSELGAIDA